MEMGCALPTNRMPGLAAITFVFLYFISLSFISPAHASSVIELDADAQFSYAEHCHKAGDYRRAVDEYKRFAWFFPDDPRKDAALFNIGKALFENGDLSEAIDAFKPLIEKKPDTAFFADAHFMTAECHIGQNAPAAAMSVLRNLTMLSSEPDTIDEARYRMGWICLDAGMWDAASQHFEQIRPEKRVKYKLRTISDELEKTDAIPQKSPVAAGMLSLK